VPPSQTEEGLRAALAIRAEMPVTAIVVLSQHVERHSLGALLETAARVVAGSATC
jgi:hypothetical protein